ncbi:MAG: hypothetical protein AB7F32_00430 [Victivallaceae bacterium]
MKAKQAQPELDLFDFGAAAPASPAATSAAPPPEPVAPEPPRGPSCQEMRQAALGFLAAQRPVGVAGVVPARFRKYQVAAAAFWTRDRGKVKEVVRTAIVEIYDHRDRSFADCADRRSLLEAIRALREKREALEANIREAEPELADRDDLFSEFRTWHYERSANAEYRKLRRKLEKLQHTLYQGSRLERIRRAAVADVLYLAVPAGLLESDEIALGWGLLYVHRDGQIEVRREPDPQLCDSASRNHLALNIAAAAAASVLFSNGVQVDAAGRPRFYRPPRRRLKRVLTETL